ncbi:MAG TPA: hypothetical protein VII94_06250 [Candidatus Saccharimonadales bacterium]
MFANKHGVVARYNGKNDTAFEVVCNCKCHTTGGRHFTPCCNTPKTSDGKFLLEAYEVTQHAL